MTRLLVLALFLGSNAFAADLGDLDELPEADNVETASTGSIDLSDDDDFAIDLSAPAPVAAPVAKSLPTVDLSDDTDDFAMDSTPAPTKAATVATPGPRLPSVDHVDFGDDDDFGFDAEVPTAAPRGVSNVELVELDEDIEASLDEDEDLRPELPELAGLDDETLSEAPVEDKGTTEDLGTLLSDDDDIELDW